MYGIQIIKNNQTLVKLTFHNYCCIIIQSRCKCLVTHCLQEPDDPFISRTVLLVLENH